MPGRRGGCSLIAASAGMIGITVAAALRPSIFLRNLRLPDAVPVFSIFVLDLMNTLPFVRKD